MPRLAYPYLRYSDDRQLQGDSRRRQGDWFSDTCAREGWQIDRSFPLSDRGKSAYHGDHLKADLGRFLAAVTSGRIPRGSVLLCEELDRLDRREKKKALPFVIGLLTAGIDIRTRDRHYTEDSIDNLGELLDIIIRQGAANDESRKKAMRIKEVWDAWRKDLARGVKRPPPGPMPRWVRWDGKAFVLVKEATAAIRLIYALAGQGVSHRGILNRLNGTRTTGQRRGARTTDADAPAVPPIGDTPAWRLSYVAKLLSWRLVLGELEAPDGTTCPGFYPAAVTEAEFARARLAMRGRRIGNPGVGRRDQDAINLFVGLLHDARDGSRLTLLNGRRPGGGILVSAAAIRREKGGVRAPFAYAVFEEAILSRLAEIDAREVLGQADGPDEVMILSGELATVEAKVGALEKELEDGDVAALARALRHQEARQRELAGRLAEARQRAASPLSEAWGEAQSLLSALDAAPDRTEARLRLRGALRRVVEGIWCVFVGQGRARLAAVQIHFRGGGVRDYIFDAAGGMPLSEAGPALLDLRKPRDAARLAKALERLLQ